MVRTIPINWLIEFENYRTGNRILNRARTIWVAGKELIRRWRRYSIKSYIDNITELRENGNKVVFETSQIVEDTKLMIGTNLPSIYGGSKEEPWYKNRTTRALSE